MARILPYRWLGPTRRAALQRELDRRLGAWAAGWLAADDRVAVLPADVLPARMAWSVASTAAGTLAIGHAHDGAATLGAALTGCVPAGDGGLARGVGLRALRGLASVLVGTDAPDLVDGQRTPAELAPRAGGLLVRVQVAGTSLWLQADAALCAEWVPVAASAERPLVTRRHAMGPLDARLLVSLPLGQLALADVSGLRPGDVLRTRVRVGGLVRLTSTDGTVARVGHLAANGEHRAIRIQ